MEVDELRIFYRWRCCMDVGHFLVLLMARTVVDLVRCTGDGTKPLPSPPP